MADRGTQLAILTIPSNNVVVGGNTYTPYVYIPVDYGGQIAIHNEVSFGSETSSVPTEGQLLPRGR